MYWMVKVMILRPKNDDKYRERMIIETWGGDNNKPKIKVQYYDWEPGNSNYESNKCNSMNGWGSGRICYIYPILN